MIVCDFGHKLRAGSILLTTEDLCGEHLVYPGREGSSSLPGSGSSSFSLSRGNAGRRASGYLRKTMYIMRTAFFLRYGLVDDICKQGHGAVVSVAMYQKQGCYVRDKTEPWKQFKGGLFVESYRMNRTNHAQQVQKLQMLHQQLTKAKFNQTVLNKVHIRLDLNVAFRCLKIDPCSVNRFSFLTDETCDRNVWSLTLVCKIS